MQFLTYVRHRPDIDDNNDAGKFPFESIENDRIRPMVDFFFGTSGAVCAALAVTFGQPHRNRNQMEIATCTSDPQPYL
jgi:hypothetical protein